MSQQKNREYGKPFLPGLPFLSKTTNSQKRPVSLTLSSPPPLKPYLDNKYTFSHPSQRGRRQPSPAHIYYRILYTKMSKTSRKFFGEYKQKK
jgi:hypothetical protein